MRDVEDQFLATIKADGKEYHRVLTKLLLPRRMSDPLSIQLIPSRDNGLTSESLFEFSLSAEIKNAAGVLAKKIFSNRIYWKSSSSRRWGNEVQEQQIIGSPQDLTISYVRSALRSSSKESSGYFCLTPCEYLSPHESVEYSYTGEVKVQTVRRLEFTLRNGISLAFDSVYRHHDLENGEHVSFPELVAKFTRVPGDANEIQGSCLNELCDFLWIVSLAHRKRCVCVGWEVHDSHGLHTCYRRGITIPTYLPQSSNETLIEGFDFEKFLKTAYAKFIGTESREFILQALFAITKDGDTVEGKFARLFSALETLVLKYRRDSNSEFVLPPEDWKIIQEDLKRAVKAHPLLSDKKEKRSQVYEKLAELNRVSFQTAFSEFCCHHRLDIHDLWPVCDSKETVSLVRIRNRLVHGEPFSHKQLMVLSKATAHLEWIIERVILTILGWPISDSRVADFHLSKIESYLKWRGLSLD